MKWTGRWVAAFMAILMGLVLTACGGSQPTNSVQKSCTFAYKTRGTVSVQVTGNQATASFDFTRRDQNFVSGKLSLLDGEAVLASGDITKQGDDVKGNIVATLKSGSHNLKAQAQVKTKNGGDDTCMTEVYTVHV